MFVSQSITRK